MYALKKKYLAKPKDTVAHLRVLTVEILVIEHGNEAVPGHPSNKQCSFGTKNNVFLTAASLFSIIHFST